MANLLWMKDFLTFKVIESDPTKKNFFECKDSKSATGSSLLATVAATHSGVVNGNFRFYRPDRMNASTHYWIDENRPPKPVLTEHDKEGSVIGRVLSAKYVDLSYQYLGEYPFLKDTLFYTDSSKKVNLFESVDWIVSNLQSQADYKGLGYIELGLKITEPEAIRKTQADEFLTVSVGFATDQAICSICHTDWAVDDKCEHRLGKMVDGKRMFLIPGNFQYKECSFVNFPADPFATTISKTLLEDSISNKMFFLGLSEDKQTTYVGNMTDSIDLSTLYEADIQVAHPSELKDQSMNVDLQKTLEDLKSGSLPYDQAIELRSGLDNETASNEDEARLLRRVKSTLTAFIRKNEPVDNEPTKEQVEAKIEILAITLSDMPVPARTAYYAKMKTEAEKYGIEVPFIDLETLEAYEDWKIETLPEEERSFFADPDAVYEQMWKRSEKDSEAEAEDAEFGALQTDAKLSSESRKKLKGSTFCGPNRSFPVPDCAHVTAARRLIGRAKVGDATKSKILSCVSRKASTMGCGGKKDSVVEETIIDLIKDSRFATDAEASIPAGTLEALDGVHKAYKKADEGGKHLIREGVYSHIQAWHAAAEKDQIAFHIKHAEQESNKSDADTKMGGTGMSSNADKLMDEFMKDYSMIAGQGVATEVPAGNSCYLPSGTSDHLAKLHSAHESTPDPGRAHIRHAAAALYEHLGTASMLQQHRELLKTGQAIGKDSVSKEEHDTLMAGIEESEKKITSLINDNETLRNTNQLLIKTLKKDRATTLVAINVLTNEPGYRDLTSDQITEQITQRAVRSLDSLKDSINDRMPKLERFVPSARADKEVEIPVKEISDNTKLPDTDTASEKEEQTDTNSMTDSRPLPKESKARAAAIRYREIKSKQSAGK